MSHVDWSPPLTRLRVAIESARLPGVAIQVERAEEETFPLGASRIGGRPDLPVDAAWPATHALPLAFIAQIDLADVAHHSNELPASGLLSFFVLDELRIEYADGVGDVPRNECARVIYTAARASLHRFDAPAALPVEVTFEPSRPAFRSVDTWPQREGTLIGERGATPRGQGGLELSRAEWEAWAKRAPRNPPLQMLGHPSGLEFPIGADPKARLLLSLDSSCVSPDICGRNGFLYFGIPGDALARCEWDRVFHKEW